MLRYLENYLSYKRSYTVGAYDRYKLWLRKFEEVINKDEREVTEEDVYRFKIWLDVRYSGKSVQYAMTVLHNYFVYLRLKGISSVIPELVKIPRARGKLREAISPQEYQQLLGFLDKTAPQNELRYLQIQLILRILFETGVRVSELTGLTIDNINLEKSGALIGSKKNTDMRWIYWSYSTNDLLKKYLPIRHHLQRNTRALFVHLTEKYGGAITKRTVERIVKTCCEGAGIKHYVPHSFRHGRAHHILELGGNLADVQKTLGHRSPLSSMKYLQYTDPEHERRARSLLPA